MKENISMTQEVINVKLTEVDGKDVLIFDIRTENNPEGIAVDLNDEKGKQDFVVVFSNILKILFNNAIRFELVIDDQYSKGLFKDVSRDYVNSLNTEIEKVYNSIEKDIKQVCESGYHE